MRLTNLIGGDARAFAQAAVGPCRGSIFYLIRRVSRSNILNSVLHAGFDLTIFSGTGILAKGEDAYAPSSSALLVYVVVGIVLLVRRHKIEPDTIE